MFAPFVLVGSASCASPRFSAFCAVFAMFEVNFQAWNSLYEKIWSASSLSQFKIYQRSLHKDEGVIRTSYQIMTSHDNRACSGSAGASVVAHGVALPLYRDCFLDLRLFNSPDLRRLVLCYCCQAWTLETVLGGNTALPR